MTDQPAPDSELVARARRHHWNSHLARHAHVRPDDVALRFEGTSSTWAQLHARVQALADGIAARGISPGDRVAVLMTNRPEFLQVVLATTLLGAVGVPVNFRLTPPEIAQILDDCTPALLATDAGLADLARASGSLAAVEPAMVVAGVEGAQALATWADGSAAAHPPVEVREDDPALIMYTSGTTGRPKGAVLSHQNLQGQAMTLIRGWRLHSDDAVTLAAAPMFHIAGIGGAAPYLFLGGTIVILPSGAFDPAAMLQLLEAERVTSLFLVPAQWQAVCAEPTLAERRLALRTISWGAAPASDTLLHRMADVFPDAVNVAVFGQTEMSPVTCLLEEPDALRKLGSVGRPVAAVDARVVDPDGCDVARGEVGEIVYRGPTTMLGYWNDPAGTAEAFRGGWFHSGDLVRQDDEGFVWVVDRAKDMIISGGENVYCAEVENVLAAHPDVVEVAVIGRADERWGEVPVAVAVLRAGADLEVVALREWCTGRLAGYKQPRDLVTVDALPRNASGKVVKPTLRAAHAG